MIAFVTGIGWVNTFGPGMGRENEFGWEPGPLPEINQKAVLKNPHRRFGRMDILTKLGLASVSMALRDAGLDGWTEKRGIGIIASTTYGCLHVDIDYYGTVMPNGGAEASPGLFAYTLPNCFQGEASIHFGLTGESFVINESDPGSLSGLRMTLAGIDRGFGDDFLCGVCDPGRPEILPDLRETVPGALFFMIRKTPDPLSYGKLGLDRSGNVFLENTEIRDLVQLARECLAKRV